ncbi:MAG: glycosyltransferase, partial [Candidatus Cloacimonetes bacterium]|nr:glycosyltransferase [Candidatus Cloacimonadota bacterium]
IETYVLAAREIDHPCYLVGSYDPALKQEMLKLNSDIIFTGKLNHNDLMKLLLSSRVYCQLSFRESFGIALAEAIACGCNPVVTDNGALPEVAGDLAEYVDYGDVPGTVLAIRKALTKELPAQDIIMIRNRFSLSAHEQILVSTLRGINVL